MKLTVTTTMEMDVTPAEMVDIGRQLMDLAISQPQSPVVQAWVRATSQAYAEACTQAVTRTMQNSAGALLLPWLRLPGD